MKIRDIFQTLLKNWAMKQLTPANVQAMLTAGLAQLRTVTDETETKIDDYILDFLESIVLDPTKIETVTDFIRSRLAGVYGDVPPACDGPVNDSYQELASQLSADGTYSVTLGQILQLGKGLAEIVPLIADFFRENQK